MAMTTTGGVVVANGTTTGAMSTMLNAKIMVKSLIRALPYLVIEKFGQWFVLPANNTKNAKFRRLEALDATPATITEGVTPTAKSLTTTDIEVTLDQYGDLVTFSDVLMDTDDSGLIEQIPSLLGEQAAEMVERVRLGVALGGTNVEYANGAARTAVNTPISLPFQRRITRKLKNQKARYFTEIVRSTPSFNTENVAPGFFAICHPDCESDIRDAKGFQDVKDYGSVPALENEIGAIEQVRYLFTTLMEAYPNAGGDKGTGAHAMLSTGGTKADVYPVLYFAKDAFGLVPFKNSTAITPHVINPTPTESDPLGQRGHVAWKTMQTAVILNQAWMVRGEVAVSAK